jgi:hypothetical protein
VNECPECGVDLRKPTDIAARSVEWVDGELKELTESPEQFTLNQLKITQKAKGYKRGWLFYEMEKRFGTEVANRLVPKRIIPIWKM